VPCSSCHTDLGRGSAGPRAAGASLALATRPGPALTFVRQPHDCAACHQDPHCGQFKSSRGNGACDACHDLRAFQPAGRFDHDRDTNFKLEGFHARVACARCHPAQRSGGTLRVTYVGAPTRCESCHTGGIDSSRAREPRKGGT
jgi:hypothetical protein